MPVHRKKRKSRRMAGPLNTKTRWLVFGAALVCIIIVAVVSMSSGGQFKDISYIPQGEGSLFNDSPQAEPGEPGKPGNQNADGTGGTAAPPHPNRAILPQEYKYPAPPAFSQAQKLNFIEQKYTFIFNNIDDYYNWELRRLLQAAANDYLAVKNGRQDMSLTQLANEYLRAGRSLEKEADDNFAVVLGQMKAELKANDLPSDLVKKAEKEYKEQKSQMRKDLLGQLGSYIND